MDPIIVKIEAPITEWCRDCKQGYSRSFYSHRSTCINCGSSSMTSQVKLHPILSFYHTSGRYGIKLSGGLSDEQSQYVFSVPGQRPISILLNDMYEELESYDTVELIEYLTNDMVSMYKDRENLKYLKRLLTDEFKESYYTTLKLNKKIGLEYEYYKLLTENKDLFDNPTGE